jgi:hypothetical protein
MRTTTVPFDESREKGWTRMQERRAWEYYPQYDNEANILKLTGAQKKFPKELRERFNEEGYEDVGRESEWSIDVPLNGNEGQIHVYAKGFKVYIGRYTGDSSACDVNNLRKMPVLIEKFEEVIEYLKENYKRMD